MFSLGYPASAFWWGVLHALGLFGIGTLKDEEKISGAVIFLPRFIRSAMKVDEDAVLDAFGKNQQTRKVFWALFAAMTSPVPARVVDPGAAEAVVETLAGIVP